MKKIIPFLLFISTVGISGCSSNTTGPVPPPTHPFPQSFKNIILTFQNLPEHWESVSYSTSLSSNNDTSSYDTGTGPSYTGNWNWNFSTSTFSSSGDTITASFFNASGPGSYQDQSVTLVADESNGILDFLSVSSSSNSSPGVAGEGTESGNGFTCYNIAYTSDSANEIVVNLSGQSLQTGLTQLSNNSYEATNVTNNGGDYSMNSDTYIDSFSATATITIHFTQ